MQIGECATDVYSKAVPAHSWFSVNIEVLSGGRWCDR
jgi:hypothetical protein